MRARLGGPQRDARISIFRLSAGGHLAMLAAYKHGCREASAFNGAPRRHVPQGAPVPRSIVDTHAGGSTKRGCVLSRRAQDRYSRCDDCRGRSRDDWGFSLVFHGRRCRRPAFRGKFEENDQRADYIGVRCSDRHPPPIRGQANRDPIAAPGNVRRDYLRFFSESGYEVVKLYRIDCPTTLAIAMVEGAGIRAALQDLLEAGSEAIVQVGTDLVFVRLAEEAKRWLGRPIVAVNAAMLWHGLRAHDTQDRPPGLGSILRMR